MIEKFWATVYRCQRGWVSFVDWIDNYAAWKSFFFLILSAVAYQILIEFESLNYAFFIFQVLLMVEAVTYFTQGAVMAYFKTKGFLIYMLIAFGICFIAVTPFLVYYPYLRIGKWPLWIFLYFTIGYPLTYVFHSYFCFSNLDIYYHKTVGKVLGILMIVAGAISLFYAFVYGAYMHYCEIPFLTREIITNIVYFVQASDMSGVERIFQFLLLANALCMSNYNFGHKIGKYL